MITVETQVGESAADETEIPTPALLVDLAVVERNLSRMAGYAKEHKLALRPHTKTHKSLFMAKKQIDHGAAGLTVAKIGEAEVLAPATKDLLVAYPCVDWRKAERLAVLAKSVALRVAVDSRQAIEAIASGARMESVLVGILIDFDMGFHRTGVQTAAETLELARHAAAIPGVRLDGLFGFPGQVSSRPEAQHEALAGISAALREAIDLWKADGLEARIVSAGSTPTALQAHLVPEWNEIRPGTYIYNDRNTFTGGWCAVEDCAAKVAATIISTAVPGKCVIDAGSKSLTTDRLAADPMGGGFGYVVEYPAAKIVRLSEEHGELDLSGCEKRPALGERVHVIPNHICPCVNLHDYFWMKDGDEFRRMKVDARGRVA